MLSTILNHFNGTNDNILNSQMTYTQQRIAVILLQPQTQTYFKHNIEYFSVAQITMLLTANHQLSLDKYAMPSS
jgi:hypothetical protein